MKWLFFVAFPALVVTAKGLYTFGKADSKYVRRNATDAAFAKVGSHAGVEVWRVKQYSPEVVSPKDFGKFYTGDSYIVLKTTADKNNDNISWYWDIYWISDAAQNRTRPAASLVDGLDAKFHGVAIQHREFFGQESREFKDLFPKGIQYLSGGYPIEKRMFQVKGKKRMRVREVDPHISSMNKGDSFVLDVDSYIYAYVGENSTIDEDLTALSVAMAIRYDEYGGRGGVEFLNKYSSEADLQRFFTDLGSGSQITVPDESDGGDDEEFEKSEEQNVGLFEVSDKKLIPLPKPLLYEQLKPEKCYILDTVSGSVFVWVGKHATKKDITEAMNKAQAILKSQNRPHSSWMKVFEVPQSREPTLFKRYFQPWGSTIRRHYPTSPMDW